MTQKEYIPSELRPTTSAIRPIRYAVGEMPTGEDTEFHLWEGPHPEEGRMLEIVGRTENSCIVRFNEDGTDEVIWKWKEYRWVAV